MFLCARCRAQVVICRKCDRGQIYCTRTCSKQARCASLRAAGRRYQASRRGRFTHAARARRYRVRQKIVTHQGSAASLAGDLLPAEAAPHAVAVESGASRTDPSQLRCHVCNTRCAQAVRLGFVRHSRRRPAVDKTDSDEHPS
jgi:hypothetical protein